MIYSPIPILLLFTMKHIAEHRTLTIQNRINVQRGCFIVVTFL